MLCAVKKLSASVLDKRISRGWLFGDSYYVTVKVSGQIREYEVPIEQYYDMQVGVSYNMTLHRHSDGLYYPQPE